MTIAPMLRILSMKKASVVANDGELALIENIVNCSGGWQPKA